MRDKNNKIIEEYFVYEGNLYKTVEVGVTSIAAIKNEFTLMYPDGQYPYRDEAIKSIVMVADKDSDMSRLDRFVDRMEVEAVTKENNPEWFV